LNKLSQIKRIAFALGSLLLAVATFPALADPVQVQKLIADGKLDQALSMTNSELAKDSENVSYRFLKGLILTRQEKLGPARDIFIDITRTHPELPEPFNNLAVIYASLGDFDKAREALEQAINTHPAYATAHENIGDIYAKLASQAYNQALELDNQNNTAKAKLSLVNELFSVPQTIVQQPVQLAEAPAAPTVQPQVSPPGPVPVREVPVPPVQPNPAPIVTASPPPQIPAVPGPPPAQISPTEIKRVPQAELQSVAMVKQGVIDWSAAWSAQDINAYLGFYAGDFTPPDGRSIAQWRLLREKRLSEPGTIRITIADLVVEMTGNTTAKATFTQNYQSDVYSDRVKKTLLLRLENGRWLITREQTS